MVINALTKEEQSLILEALLFASGGDIDADWDIDATKDMLELAEKLKNEIGEDYNISHLRIFPPDGDNVDTSDWPLADKIYFEITRHIMQHFDKINVDGFEKVGVDEKDK